MNERDVAITAVRPPTKRVEDEAAAFAEAKSVTDELRAIMPGEVFSDAKTTALFEREPAIRHDPETGSYAWVAVNRERRVSSVVWLLPLNLPADDHRHALAASLRAAGDAEPDALDWEVFAIFRTPGERQAARLKAETWRQIFTNDALGIRAEVVSNRDGTEARISLATLRDAIAVTEAWR